MRIHDAAAPITLEIPAGIRSPTLERMAEEATRSVKTSEFTVPVRYDGEAVVGPASPGACRKCFNLRRAAAAATPDLGRGLSKLAGSGSAADPPDALAGWVEAAARRILANAPADRRRGVGRVIVVERDGRASRFVFRPRYDCRACRALLRAGRPAPDPVSETLASREVGLLTVPTTQTGWPHGVEVWTGACCVSNHRFAPFERTVGEGSGMERSQAKLASVSRAVARYAVSAAARAGRGGELRGRDLFTGHEVRLSAADVLADGPAQPDAWATAARRTWREAVDAALLEIAGHDAFMAVWFEGRRSLQVDEVGDSEARSVWGAVEATGARLELRLAPAVSGAALAIATITEASAPKFVLGLGCAREPAAAAREAVAHAVHMRRMAASRPTAAGSRPGAAWFADHGLSPEASRRVFGVGPAVSWDSMRAWLPSPAIQRATFAEQMAADGFAPVAVDITPPDVRAEGWLVARVGAPTLRRLRPGAEAAPCDIPRAEAELHPLS